MPCASTLRSAARAINSSRRASAEVRVRAFGSRNATHMSKDLGDQHCVIGQLRARLLEKIIPDVAMCLLEPSSVFITFAAKQSGIGVAKARFEYCDLKNGAPRSPILVYDSHAVPYAFMKLPNRCGRIENLRTCSRRLFSVDDLSNQALTNATISLPTESGFPPIYSHHCRPSLDSHGGAAPLPGRRSAEALC